MGRPPFALEHLYQLDADHLIYHNPQPRSDSPRDLELTPLELIGKIAALVPPPRAHRHRYYGVLAPNSPMRAQDSGSHRRIGEAPESRPARGPPLWESAMATEQAGNDPQRDMSAQPVLVFEFDQRIAW